VTIDKETFELWRAHPITEAMVKSLVMMAERNKAKWIEVSWGGGQADPLVLADLRARAEMAQDLSELTVDELNEVLDEK